MLLSPYIFTMPYQDQSFDVIVCNHVIEHVTNDTQLINEVYRILKKNGSFIIMFPINEESIDVPTHLRKYTFDQFQKIIENKFSIDYYGENDTFSHLIRLLASQKNLFSNILKKSLIFIISIIPFNCIIMIDLLLRKSGLKNSQIYAILKKGQINECLW